MSTVLPPVCQAHAHRAATTCHDTLHRRFEVQVERTPDATAITFITATGAPPIQLTYHELNQRANQLAHYLQTLSLGRAPGDEPLLGLCLDRSPTMIIGLLAILKIGGAYVPLDPGYPQERLAFMLDDANLAALITQQPLPPNLPPVAAPLLDLTHAWPQIAQQPTTNPTTPIAPHHLAYVIYTSGSTGRPKGVLVEHGGLSNLVAVQQATFALRPGDRVLQFASLNFDASIWEIAMTLCSGATLYLAPASLLLPGPPLARFLADHAITHLTLIPTALAALRPEEAPALQCVIVAGEACPAVLAQRWLAGRRFFNAYGPTETTVCATMMACQADTPFTNSAPIGQAIANVDLYLLDEAGQPTRPGEVGELYIGGATLARGYLNRPALTAEKFIPNPFGDPATPGRLYRTGDRVRQVGGPPGDPILEFLGRVDQQVKVRGFRIELGEIEARLAEHPQVQSAVVAIPARWPVGDSLPQLTAYVVPAATSLLAPPRLRAELRHFLQSHLPDYMTPAAIVIMPTLPLMPNGKVNRPALPPPTTDAFVIVLYVAPQSATEETLATLWGELLGLPAPGRDANFFASGGHSLLATQLLAQVRARFGCDLSLRALFAAPTIATLAALIDQQPPPTQPLPPPIQPGPRPAHLPLSSAQQRLWFLAQLEGASAAYTEPFALRLHGPLDPHALQAALQAVVDRHEALRTTFPAVDGIPYQQITAALPLPLPLIDLSANGASEEPEATLQRLVQEAAWQPFDLTSGPLLRATLYRCAATDHLLLLVFHHIVIDGWSLGRLLAELDEFYRAYQRHEPTTLPPLSLQYADYARWQRAWLQGPTLAAEQRYWQAQLADAPTLLPLPTDFPRPPVQSFRGGTVDFLLDQEVTAALQRLCQAQEVTPFMVIYTAFAILLARYSGQEDLLIGATVANRQQPELAPLIGFFVNTLPLRADLHGNPTGAELLARVRQMTLDAYAHQNLPFEQLVSDLAGELTIERNLGYAPLCQVMLTFDNTQSRLTTLGDLRVTPVALAGSVAKFDLTLSLTELPTTLAATLTYNCDLFRADTIERLAGHWQVLLRALLTDPTTPVAQLPLLTPAEQHQLLVTWNQTRTPYPQDQTIHALFAAQAARTPTAMALIFAEETETRRQEEGERAASCLPVFLSSCLTYSALDMHANQLAHYLRRRGVGAGTLVGLYLDRSPLAVVALLGILKAGGAYVPLDPTYPAERLAWMVAETATPLILTTTERRADLPAATPTLCLDSEWALVVAEPTTPPLVTITADHLAYVMFTSGSTGQPKGVCVSHRNVVRLVQQTDFVNLSADEVFLQLAPLAFDAATFEIWGALLNGARLVVMPPGQPSLAAIGAAIRQHGVTTLWLTAGLFHLIVDEQLDILRPLRQLLAGGDVLSMAHVRRVLQALPHCRLINGYGPTENTTFTCCYTFPSDPPVNAPAPIGRPIANSQVYLLDKALQPVPIGVPGELYAGGDGVAHGYLNRPALTAERFIANPFGDPAGGDKLYKTGDLARWLPDGVIEFLGRLDQQVKIRGFRVEPGEIEALLTQHPVVQSAAVVAQPAGNDKQLVAYLVVAEEAAAPSLTDTLRAFLQTRLPPYMLPSRFFYLDALPLTTNGKVDRRALPLLAPEAAATDSADQSPQTPTEELLAAIWRNLLADQPVGRQSDFFAIGGHSLLATQVVARVADTFGIVMGVRTLFEAPTLAAFAAVIDQRRRMGQAGLVLPPLLPSHTQPTPLPLSFAQQRLWFLEQLEGASGLYNIPLALRLHGALDERALHCALQQIVQRHAILRTTFPATDGVAAQVIAPTLDLSCPRLVIEGAGAAAEAALHQALQAELWRPFDLAAGPLLRATLYALTPTEHLLALTFHHVIADGWSLAIFLDELAACYAAACGKSAAPLAPLPVQYADFTRWQRDWLQGETLAQQQAYWRQQLAHAPSLLTLPTDALRPAVQSYRGGAVTQALPPALTAGLQELSQREGVSLFMTCYAAWAVLLARYSGQEDLVIGAPIANRQQQALEPLIGFFVNTLPLRADLTGNPPFRGLLQRVRRLTLDAYAHQDIPFEQVVSDLGLPRTLSHAPLFQVMLAFNNVQPLRRTLADLTVTPVALAAVLPAVMARFDLTLHIERTADGWQTTWEYNRDLFTSATIERMAGHFQALLAAIVAAPATPIQQLPLLTPAEQHQLLMAWNPPATPYPQDQTIHALFAAQAERTPTAMAVIFAEETATGRQEDRETRRQEAARSPSSCLPVFLSSCLTYAELDACANQLAHYLRAAGVGPGALVGLCLERSPALLVGILGILKAGGAYVPLDPAYPLERLHFVCADTGMRVVVTEQALGDRFAQGDLGDLQVIALDRDWALISQADRCAPVTSVQPTDLAYVIYTSGSTGQPKGVMVTHRNLVHSTTARFRYYAQPVARFLLLSSFAFDSSVAGIFWTLCQGGALVLPRPGDEKDLAGLARLISDHGVTHLLALPSLYRLLLTYSDRAHLRSLQVAIVAGEACPPALPAQHSSTLPAATLYNEYGPTEGTVWSSVYRFPPTWQGAAVPISSLPQDALPNIQLYVLDHHQQPVPIGVPGELYIGGAGITPGYWQQPALTAEKFIADPFHLADPTARLYRTGDLVRYRADGHLDFLGRIDQQVKVRGFRIELGEIEAALRQHPAIQTAAVVVWQEQLVAYVVGAGEAERQGDKVTRSEGVEELLSSALPVSVSELRAFLQVRLPDYMMPARWVGMWALPLLPNGKVDRAALPAPVAGTAMAPAVTPEIAPRTAAERELAAIWQRLLGVPQVGREDDFFALGGHSLLLAQLTAQVRQHFHTPVALRTLFQASTLAGMSAAITAAATAPPVVQRATPTAALPASPYRRYLATPLDHAIQQGDLPPVDAAALAYWPDDLLDKHRLSRSAVLETAFTGRAIVAGILETAWGRIATILLPRLHSELYVDPTLPDAIEAALQLAGALGAQTVSLTGLLPSATDYGRAIPSASSEQAARPRITTGHAMTAAAVVLNVEQLVQTAGRTLAQERLACLGLGSIGLSSLELLLQVAPHPQSILLCDLATRLPHLQQIRTALVERFGFGGDVELVPVQREVPPAVYTASLIVGATNVPDVLAVDRLPAGVLLVDDSGPHCFDPQLAFARLAQQSDLLFTEGGAVALSTPVQQTIYTPPQWPTLLAESGLADPQVIMGCALSSLLSARWPDLPPTVGAITPELALAYYRRMRALGIQAAPLHCAGQLLPTAAINQFRKMVLR